MMPSKSSLGEARLLESRDSFRHLAESMPLIVWTATADGEVDYVTQALTEYTALPQEQLLGAGWASIIHPDDRDAAAAGWSEVVQEGVVHRSEFRIRRNDGEYRWHLVEARPIRNEDGSIRRWLGTATDIDDRRRMEEESRWLAQHFVSTTESMREAIYLLDRNWRMVFVNAAGADMAQRPRSALVGQVLWDAFPDVVGTDIDTMYHEVVEEGTPREFVYRYGPYDLWVDVRCYPSPEGLAVYMRDITAERMTELQLGETQERFRNVVRATTDAIWDWDLSTGAVWWSEGIRESFGIDPKSLAPDLSSWTDRIHPADLDRVNRSIDRALEDGDENWEDEYRFLRVEGRYTWVRDRGFIVRGADGAPLRMVGGLTDESITIEAQQQIREQAELLDRAQDAILVRDMGQRIVYWNRGAERLYGWSAQEVMGRPVGEVIGTNPEILVEATAALLEVGEWSGEIEQRRKDGKSVMVEGRWSLVRDPSGSPHRILSINTDITERKRLMAEFLRAQRMESIGTLAGGIAHDLNNVLAPILLSIGILREEVRGAEVDEVLDTIEASAQRGADMVRQVLAFARGMDGRRVPTEVKKVLEDMGRVVRDTFPRSISFHCTLSDDVHPILGDPTQIHQVLMNVFVNARDAMPHGGTLTVTASNLDVDAQYAAMSGAAVPGPHVQISVVDSGTGMAPDILDRIFDPFFTTKEVGKGTGLGLSTVAAIMRSHGGFVNVDSERGSGSTFHLYFPATPGSVSGSVPPEPAEKLPRGSGELILLVDDDAAVREVTRRTLEAFGYRVVTATDGADAVAVYGRMGAEVAVVLTDVMMPIMDGPTTVAALRRMNPEVRVVAASGMGADAASPVRAGLEVSHFLTKPYTAKALLQAIHSVIHDPLAD